MAKVLLKKPLKFLDGTGVDITPNEDLNGSEKHRVTFNIGQDVGTDSDVRFNQLNITTNTFILDDSSMVLFENQITGSFTQTGTFIVSGDLTGSGNLTILGSITADEIFSEVSESITIFDSGSTIFGDSIDDTHNITGSVLVSGSLVFNNFTIDEISKKGVDWESNLDKRILHAKRVKEKIKESGLVPEDLGLTSYDLLEGEKNEN